MALLASSLFAAAFLAVFCRGHPLPSQNVRSSDISTYYASLPRYKVVSSTGHQQLFVRARRDVAKSSYYPGQSGLPYTTPTSPPVAEPGFSPSSVRLVLVADPNILPQTRPVAIIKQTENEYDGIFNAGYEEVSGTGRRQIFARARRDVPGSSYKPALPAPPPQMYPLPSREPQPVQPAPSPVGMPGLGANPNFLPQTGPVAIIKQTEENEYDGTFNYSFEADNGIIIQMKGTPRTLSNGEVVQTMEGHYSYTAPDGTPITTRWFADETGFHAEGTHIPGSSG